MVMADKNSLGARNGKRSRGASPNSSEHSDSSEDQEKGIRIGEEYQAEIPGFNPNQKHESGTEAMLIWAPTNELSDAKVDEYINVAKEKHGYNTEQALGMLFWHKHNVDRALADLANFTPFPDEWTVEDKVLFEQAYNFHGKQFHRIRQMLPDKSIPSLVKYFYSWKKTRSRTSLMDRHAKRRHGHRQEGDQDGDGASDSSSDVSGHDLDMKAEEEEVCKNCGLQTTQLHMTSVGSQCSTCYQYWRRTGEVRVAGPKRHESLQSRHNPIKHKRRPPKGMYLDSSDLHTMVTSSQPQAQAVLKTLDSDIVTLKRQVQNNKQMLSLQKHKLGTGVEDFRPAELPHKINSRWSNEDLLLAVQGVRKYGKDFKAIADVIGNKLEVHVRSFFINFRRRYNLDEVLAEYEAEHGAQVISDQEETTVSHVLLTSASTPAASQLTCQEVKDSTQAEGGECRESPAVGRPAPHMNGTTGNSSNAHLHPPPLLSQPATLLPGHVAAIAPSSITSARLPTPQKTVLQQPPPLIRPPIHSSGPLTSTTPTMHC